MLVECDWFLYCDCIAIGGGCISWLARFWESLVASKFSDNSLVRFTIGSLRIMVCFVSSNPHSRFIDCFIWSSERIILFSWLSAHLFFLLVQHWFSCFLVHKTLVDIYCTDTFFFYQPISWYYAKYI